MEYKQEKHPLIHSIEERKLENERWERATRVPYIEYNKTKGENIDRETPDDIR